ncbi:arginine deiminase [Corynebacterium kutscheri]|uniref:Arginine deiminase n=1 Tax=Corynebacterium kutscheri TaxID=35755 RepID=A0A0F6QY25_9CORY|nr:arginine deiminase [Corynebacterium kutscheri]AKE40342.1 arginine deiminase [Corynebacterium kutscheri]VEH05396.1 arginine deiminase [Corynebacterium kutscheri]VEH10736.1 arginine deiminase [Corynebacterium kutscheri]VEH80784.1 arginine deiminase [Corynebacterium kutscheri]
MEYRVSSEVGKLRQVILHRPGREMDRLTPTNKDELLFDDILWTEQGQIEHDAFAQALRKEDVEVLYLDQLLAETLEVQEAREWVSAETFEQRWYGVTGIELMREYADSLNAKDLAELFIAGMTKAELVEKVGCLSSAYIDRSADDFMVLRCLPNHLFTRDTSCWIYNGVSVNSMQKPARQRETINVQAIYQWHPRFADANFSLWSHGLEDGPATIEGGDVAVIGNGAVLVGISERTTAAGFERLGQALLTGCEEITSVTGILMKEERAQMHLDTVMTMVNEDTFLKYKHLGMLPTITLTRGSHGSIAAKTNAGEDMHKVLAKALGKKSINILTTPENDFAAERGQWNDACNVFTVEPNVVVSYDRNPVANEYLEAQGIRVIAVPGAELGRGRGGPRCMSCPTLRDDI